MKHYCFYPSSNNMKIFTACTPLPIWVTQPKGTLIIFQASLVIKIFPYFLFCKLHWSKLKLVVMSHHVVQTCRLIELVSITGSNLDIDPPLREVLVPSNLNYSMIFVLNLKDLLSFLINHRFLHEL